MTLTVALTTGQHYRAACDNLSSKFYFTMFGCLASGNLSFVFYSRLRVRCHCKESSRSLSHLLMSFLLLYDLAGQDHTWRSYDIISVFAALHGMQTWSSDENHVCPSVHLSAKRVHCDKRKKDMFRFLYHTKNHLS